MATRSPFVSHSLERLLDSPALKDTEASSQSYATRIRATSARRLLDCVHSLGVVRARAAPSLR